MDSLTAIYESETLFPLFSNRVISRSRPEFKDYLRWLGLAEMENDPMSMLALTGGIRGTDEIELFPPPTVTSTGDYQLEFFARGIRHLPKETIEQIGSIAPSSRLFLMEDRQNAMDPFAIALRTDEPVIFAGYCPRYYAKDLKVFLDDARSGLEIRAKCINTDAPLNMRLLCTVTARLSSQFSLFDTEIDFEPITNTVPSDWSGLTLEIESSTASQ
jgi:hypothetical protein